MSFSRSRCDASSVIEIPQVRGSQLVDIANRCLSASDFRFALGHILGCGEQGCAYSISDDPTKVIKITPFKSADQREAWINEVKIGCELGHLGVAPIIFKSFQCSAYGFIVMSKLMDATKNPDGRQVRIYDASCDRLKSDWKSECDKLDHLSVMPEDIQKAFVEVLQVAIDHNFVHMDNHIENIGYLTDGRSIKPCLFDFGFTQRRHMTPDIKKYALAFSIAQILEHCPYEEMQRTYFFRAFLEILGLRDLSGFQVPARRSDSLAIIKANYNETPNADIILGTLCYCYILPLEKPTPARGSIFLDAIYEIRGGKFLSDSSEFSILNKRMTRSRMRGGKKSIVGGNSVDTFRGGLRSCLKGGRSAVKGGRSGVKGGSILSFLQGRKQNSHKSHVRTHNFKTFLEENIRKSKGRTRKY